MSEAIRAGGEALRERVVEFCRDLVRIPSFSGEEGEAAERTAQEMRELGYDEARERVRRERFAKALEVLDAPAEDLEAFLALAEAADEKPPETADGE